MDNEVDRSNEFDLLTPQEWDCYSRLSEAWNEFIKLPVLFPGDIDEFARYVNILKSMVMSRPVMKEMVKRDWPGYKTEDEG
jgi:hypothetical protein